MPVLQDGSDARSPSPYRNSLLLVHQSWVPRSMISIVPWEEPIFLTTDRMGFVKRRPGSPRTGHAGAAAAAEVTAARSARAGLLDPASPRPPARSGSSRGARKSCFKCWRIYSSTFLKAWFKYPRFFPFVHIHDPLTCLIFHRNCSFCSLSVLESH